jgi:hypothetical protein
MTKARARIGETINIYKIAVEKIKGKDHFRYLGTDSKIILPQVLIKYNYWCGADSPGLR